MKGGEILRSIDDGQNWTVVHDIDPTDVAGEPWELVVAASNPSMVLATMGDPVVLSANGGATFAPLATAHFDGTTPTIGITAAFDPQDATTIHFATFRVLGVNVRLKTTNGGTTFTDVTPVDATRAFRVRVSPHDSNIVVVGTAGDGIEYSTDGGLTYTRHASGPTVGTAPGDFAQAPSDPLRIYLRGGAGLHRTNDNGTTWSRVSIPSFITWRMAVHPTNPDRLLEAPVFLAGNGLHVSSNGGAGWGTVSINGHAVMCILFDPANPDHVFACGYGYGLTTPHHGVYASVDGGLTFGQVPITPASWDSVVVPSALAMHPTVAGALVVATVGGLFVTDAARVNYTWVAALGNPNLQSIAVTTTTWAAGGQGVIWSSPDNGVTWRSYAIPGVAVQDIAVDASRPSRILVAASAVDRDFTAASLPGLYVSDDAGVSFRRVSQSVVPSDQFVRLKLEPGTGTFLAEQYSSAGGLVRIALP